MAATSGAPGQDAYHCTGREDRGPAAHRGGCGPRGCSAATAAQEPADADDALMAFVDGDALLAFSRRLELLGSGART